MIEVQTAPAFEGSASFGNLPSSASLFQTTTSSANSNNELSHHQKRVFGKDFSLLHQDDFGFYPAGVVVGSPSLFTYTSLLSQQKKQQHSSSQDIIDQGTQSPWWAPDLATSIKNTIPSIPKVSFFL